MCSIVYFCSTFLIIKNEELRTNNKTKGEEFMTKEEEDEVHRLVQSVGVVQLSRVMFKGMDVSEMINVIILAGRGYSVKLLTWFKYYCEVMPLFIMLFHVACMVTFASHGKEMCVWFRENWVSAAFIYFSVYIHPLVLILCEQILLALLQMAYSDDNLPIWDKCYSYRILECFHHQRNGGS